MKAKRLVFPGKEQVEIEDFEIEDTPGPGEILVESLYGLISPGTELAMFTESHIGFPIPEFRYAKYPFYPGYASIGRAVLVGEGVENIAEGETVFLRGKHASHALVSADRPALKVPEEIPLEHVPFAALANISLTAVRLSNMRLGHTVAVFGQGLIGNFAAQLMQCAGAQWGIGIDLVPERLALSARCGIDIQINAAEEDPQERIRNLTDGEGCQIVVEATGDPQAAPQALRAAARMGQVILLGSSRGTAEIDLYFDLHTTGVSLIGAHAGRAADAAQYGDPNSQTLILNLIARKRLQIAPLHTHSLPASEADLAYNGLLNEKDKFLGVLLNLGQWG